MQKDVLLRVYFITLTFVIEINIINKSWFIQTQQRLIKVNAIVSHLRERLLAQNNLNLFQGVETENNTIIKSIWHSLVQYRHKQCSVCDWSMTSNFWCCPVWKSVELWKELLISMGNGWIQIGGWGWVGMTGTWLDSFLMMMWLRDHIWWWIHLCSNKSVQMTNGDEISN